MIETTQLLDNRSVQSKSKYDIGDVYGFARAPEKIDRIPYGRFRNVYLYITDQCQLHCGHCYMGDRLYMSKEMPTKLVLHNLVVWRKMGGSKLSILGGEPTLHPEFELIVKFANHLGYEKVIVNTNGLATARRALEVLKPEHFAYIQISLDGASSNTHDVIRGKGTFKIAWETTKKLCQYGFDTRIICTVNKVNLKECLELLPMADEAGVKLVKYHVFSGIGLGINKDEWFISPHEWIDFYENLERYKGKFNTQIWYQPTYALHEKLVQYASEGYKGCIGRTLDRISIFPNGQTYVCSYLFDTELNYANMIDGRISLNKEKNEFDLFTSTLVQSSCSNCKVQMTCMGGCPAEKIVMGEASCVTEPDIVPVCRLWKSSI